MLHLIEVEEAITETLEAIMVTEEGIMEAQDLALEVGPTFTLEWASMEVCIMAE